MCSTLAEADRVVAARRLRVLHVIPSVAERYGGPSQAVVEMCCALRGAGVETVLATTDADGPGRLDVSLGRLTVHKGLPTIFFPRQWSEAFKYSGPLATWLDRHVAQFDVVHVHAVFTHSSVAAASACRRRGVPYVVRPLGTLDPWSMRQKPLRKRLFWYLGVRSTLRSAAAIHYTTLEEQRLVEQSLGLSRGAVVPLGVGEEVVNAQGEPFRALYPALGSSPYALAMARLHPKKGFDQFLRAFSRVARREPLSSWRLVLAGDGEPEYAARLHRIVEEEGSQERVLFTGWLRGSAKVAALRDADLFVMPSLQENFGISVAEAMACGTPVLVSTHVNLAAEVKVAGAGWVSLLAPDEMEQTLGRVLRDPDERVKRGEAARQYALAHFRWPAVATQLINLYQSIARVSSLA